MRAESAGCYGNRLVATPHMDRLAAEGVRFENCFVQHTVCTPSRVSFMTGWYPHVRGHRTLWHMLRPDEPNLLKYLKAAGYQVRWWGKNDLLARESFAESVTSASDPGGKCFGGNPWPADDPRRQSFLYEPFAGAPEENGDCRLVDAAVEFLRSAPHDPFLIYLPLTYTHPPYSAPREWHDRVDPAALPPLRPAGLPGKPDYHELIRRSRRLDELDDALFRKIQAVYLGMAGFSDWLLGRLLTALDETGLAKDTAVIVFSDHGDYAGDFGLVEKWPSGLEDVLTRVPFIVRAPGGAGGHVVREPVEMFDLMPTVLELAGLRARHTHFARSLVPQMGGAAGDPARAAFAEGGYGVHEPHCFEGRQAGDQAGRSSDHIYHPKGRVQQEHPESIGRAAMVRTASHKLVRRPGGTSELYDLVADPRELENLWGRPEQAAVQTDLERRLLDRWIETSDAVPLDEDPRGLP
jgi:choline-sulfatase